MEARWTAALGRDVWLRDGDSDHEVWDATFGGLYHLPPAATPPPRSVLDLGANIGLTAAHYKTLWPEARVVAVEMDAACAEIARRNAPDVPVLCCAVNGAGFAAVYKREGWSSNYALAEHGDTGVACYPLRQLIEETFQYPVDLVKMDVEGAEWGIFEHGDWASLVGSLLAELHGPDSDDALVAVATRDLEGLGYTVVRHPSHPRAVWATR